MNKLYSVITKSLLFILLMGTGSALKAQYTAIRTGNWSSAATWDVNGRPTSAPGRTCTNCTIVINSGVTVTLDEAVTLAGNSKLTVGSDGSAPAELLIPNTGDAGGFLSTAHSKLILNFNSGVTTIVLPFANSSVNASAAGQYDGVYNLTTSFFIVNTFNKLVGVAPSAFNTSGTTVNVTNEAAPPNKIITGPGTTLSNSGILPIVLGYFNAVASSDGVNLSWTTEMESNSSHFDVERSSDGVTFNSIGTVAAAGMSAVTLTYSFTDASPAAGANYYRLGLVDKDGKTAYSPIKVVLGKQAAAFTIFPNPAKDLVNVTLNNNVNATLRLVNIMGQVLVERKITTTDGSIISLPVSTYAKGQYLLELIGSDGTRQSKMVLIAH